MSKTKKAPFKERKRNLEIEENYSDDEINAFQSQREKILLDDEEGIEGLEMSDEEFYEPVMDLSDDDGDDDGDDDDDDDYDDDDEMEGLGGEGYGEEEDEKEGWGRSRKAYYSADIAPEDLLEEAVEARKLQKKQLSAMSEDDYGSSQKYKGGDNKKGGVILQFEEEESVDDDDNDKNELNSLGNSINSKSDRFSTIKDIQDLDTAQLESLLPEEERRQILLQYGPEVKKFLGEFQTRLTELKNHLEPTLKRLSGVKTDQGLSFLETKYQLLMGYCANLAFYLLLKLEGGIDIERHPVIERLVKYRLLLEKIRPMEAKLQNQVDQLIRAATLNSHSISNKERADKLTKEQEALALCPTIDIKKEEFMNSDFEDDDDDANAKSDDEDKADYNRKLYKAPKLQALSMKDEKEDKLEQRQRLLSGQEKFNEHTDEECPEEDFIDPVYGQRLKSVSSRPVREREDYEEDNLVRFTLSKKEMKMAEKLQNKPIDELDNLDAFFDDRFGKEKYDDDGEEDEDSGMMTMKKGKRKMKSTESKTSHKVVLNEGDSEMSEIEDDLYENDDDKEASNYYREMEKQSQAKKQAKQQAKKQKSIKPIIPVRYKPIKDLKPGAPRPASYQILKNKGLTPSRPKEMRNPRVRQRQKWERAQKRIKSFKSLKNDSKRAYSGETSGIRTNITKSVKFS